MSTELFLSAVKQAGGEGVTREGWKVEWDLMFLYLDLLIAYAFCLQSYMKCILGSFSFTIQNYHWK